ncbi:MAG: hypothetical protein OXI96_08810 [Acidimicrobiaceae bacterium]|nr:hypothetical protein [Acidimicrobiaceae bacterium]
MAEINQIPRDHWLGGDDEPLTEALSEGRPPRMNPKNSADNSGPITVRGQTAEATTPITRRQTHHIAGNGLRSFASCFGSPIPDTSTSVASAANERPRTTVEGQKSGKWNKKPLIRSKQQRLAASTIMLILALVAAACGSDSDNALVPTTSTETVSSESLTTTEPVTVEVVPSDEATAKDPTDQAVPSESVDISANPTPEVPASSTAEPVEVTITNPAADIPASSTPEPEIITTTCDVVTPEQTEGPFYFDAGQVRSNITEGKPGIPLLVRIRLVRVGSCEPIRDAAVDIWHADAAGHYSGYPRQGRDRVDTSGETFLRGRQFTDADGLAEFETIYPGWYEGRTVHIHFKAYSEERGLITSQLYFPDDITAKVLSTQPYSARSYGNRTNEDDGIFDDTPQSEALMGHLTSNGDGYIVSLTVTYT